MRRAVVPNADDMRLLLSAFYLKVDPDRRHHWRTVASEFERRTRGDPRADRDPMRVIGELSLLNDQLRKKYSYDLTSVVPSPQEMRNMLAAFYQKHVQERQHSWVQVAEELRERVARGSPPGTVWHAEAVLLEFIQLNQELRLKYGHNLNSVASHWLPGHAEEEFEGGWGLCGDVGCILMAVGVALMLGAWAYQGATLSDIADLIADNSLIQQAAAALGAAGAAGAAARAGGRRQGWGHQVPPTRLNLDVTLETLYTGGTEEVSYQRTEVCPDCLGEGGHTRVRCGGCGGAGFQIANTPFGRAKVQCGHCGGRGSYLRDTCHTCGGNGIHRKTVSTVVAVPRGAADGEAIRLAGMGSQRPRADDGDLVMTVRTKAHRQLRREGDDLLTDVRLSFKEAMLGFEREIAHPDGGVMRVTNQTETTSPDAVLVWPGRGMPPSHGAQANRTAGGGNGGFGDLRVRAKVRLPSRLKGETRERLRELLLEP